MKVAVKCHRLKLNWIEDVTPLRRFLRIDRDTKSDQSCANVLTAKLQI